MTIEREGHRYFLICDLCGETASESYDSFKEAVQGQKTLMWESQQYKSEWDDVCPDCQD